jgi:hypothetical protein
MIVRLTRTLLPNHLVKTHRQGPGLCSAHTSKMLIALVHDACPPFLPSSSQLCKGRTKLALHGSLAYHTMTWAGYSLGDLGCGSASAGSPTRAVLYHAASLSRTRMTEEKCGPNIGCRRLQYLRDPLLPLLYDEV